MILTTYLSSFLSRLTTISKVLAIRYLCRLQKNVECELHRPDHRWYSGWLNFKHQVDCLRSS